MKKLLILIAAIAVFPLGMERSFAQDISNDELFHKMMASIENLKTLKFSLKKWERIDGKMKSGSQDVKMNVKPFRAYLYIHEPDKGAEVLYREGENGGDALVNPNKFPYFNLDLNPYGSILRKDQHHTIFELGFDYTGDLLQYVYDKFKHKMDEYVINEGTHNWKGRDCYKLTLLNKDYEIQNYTVQPREDVIKIARKLRLSEYKIVELNRDVDDYDDVKPGQVIKVPSTYCKKVTVYVDKEYWLPIYQIMYDEVGKFAEYEYINLQINPHIAEEEFTADYPDYDF